MIIISACLAGVRCRFDGKDNYRENVATLVRSGSAILVCPEQLGGLSTPRSNPERLEDRIVSEDGIDLTEEYEKGAEEALKIAKLAGCTTAILKARSPSCGSYQIYDGSFSGTLIIGDGVFAEKCKMAGIKVCTEEEI